MAIEDNFLEAVKKLREASKEKERKFDQTVDLIVNLKDFDVRKQAFSIFVQVPNKVKDKRVAGFFEKDNKLIDVVKKDDFGKYKEKRDVKKLVKSYDFFIANGKIMPAVATAFGRILGPVGKMPSPQLGIITSEEENVVKGLIDKINSSVRVRVKEADVKVGIGKISLDDNKIVENALSVYNKVLDNLPKGIDNVRNVRIKLTMGKPVGVDVK